MLSNWKSARWRLPRGPVLSYWSCMRWLQVSKRQPSFRCLINARRNVTTTHGFNPQRSNYVFGRNGDPKSMAKEILLVSFTMSVSILVAVLIPGYEPLYYRYTSLRSESSFRILVLEKGRGEDPIKCHLRMASSFNDEEYEALSYVWGENVSGRKEQIICDRRAFMIQPNLASALRAIRYPTKNRALWVDAICINQNNTSEKAFQVPLMRDIYANARKVIIWLGAERGVGEPFAFLKWLSSYFDEQGNRLQSAVSESESGNTWDRIKSGQHQNFISLVGLLNREWFIRTWVVQELASAQSAVLIWGDETISWDLVSDVFTKLRHPSLMVSDMEDPKTQAALNSLLAMENARRSVNGTYSLSLFQILLATCFNHCSDPRDKIYAVLGMAKDWRKKGGLVPDYSPKITAEEVFRRFATWDIQKNGKIRILSCATGVDNSSDLPSWAPDWRNIKNNRPFVLYSDQTMFSASGPLSVEAWYSDHGQVLHTLGEVVDSVDAVGSDPKFCKMPHTYPLTGHELNKLAALVNWLAECRQLAADKFGERISRKRYQQFWRTMTCGLTGDASPVTPEYEGYFQKYWDVMMSTVNVEKSNSGRFVLKRVDWDAISRAMRRRSGPVDSDQEFMKHALIESSLENWASKRRFSTTSEGRLAFVPPGAHKGDLVCILYGSEVPYLLRPQGPDWPDNYVVVGECYVDGIMHGQALSRDISRLRHFKLV